MKLRKTEDDTRWKKTHAKVVTAIHNYSVKNGRFPTQIDLVKVTRLCKTAIDQHLKAIKVSDYMPELQAATPEIVKKLAEKAMTGETKAIRLWLQFVEGWRPSDPGLESTNTDVEINIGFDDAEN